MKKIIGIVGKNQAFISGVAQEMRLLHAVNDTISVNKELIEILSEIYPLTPQAVEEDTLEEPVQVTESDHSLFYAHAGRGVYSVRSGPVLSSPSEIIQYYKNKVGASRWGKFWLLDGIVKLVTQENGQNTTVYLVKDLSIEEALELRARLKGDFALVQAVEEETQEAEEGVEKTITEEVHEETDIVMRNKETVDGIKREATRLLTKLKTLWNKQEKQEGKTNDKPRITRTQFRS